MNNEPVAWLINGKLFEEYFRTSELDKIIPLYTHPAETITLAELRQTDLYRKEQTRHLRELLEPKTLTNEEIDKLWHSDEFYEEWTDGSISAIHYNKFARAILKKASEK
jgi:hypothetical protein